VIRLTTDATNSEILMMIVFGELKSFAQQITCPRLEPGPEHTVPMASIDEEGEESKLSHCQLGSTQAPYDAHDSFAR